MARNNLVRALIGVVLAKAAVVGSWYLYQQAVKEEEENKNRNVMGSARGGSDLDKNKTDQESSVETSSKATPAKQAVKKAARPAKKAVKKVSTETPAKKAVKKAPRKTAAKKVTASAE